MVQSVRKETKPYVRELPRLLNLVRGILLDKAVVDRLETGDVHRLQRAAREAERALDLYRMLKLTDQQDSGRRTRGGMLLLVPWLAGRRDRRRERVLAVVRRAVRRLQVTFTSMSIGSPLALSLMTRDALRTWILMTSVLVIAESVHEIVHRLEKAFAPFTNTESQLRDVRQAADRVLATLDGCSVFSTVSAVVTFQRSVQVALDSLTVTD